MQFIVNHESLVHKIHDHATANIRNHDLVLHTKVYELVYTQQKCICNFDIHMYSLSFEMRQDSRCPVTF